MGAFEQKFKVGDRVRRVEESMWPNQYGVVGEEYTVLGFSTNDALVIFEGCNGASPSAFELVEQPWQPKVGDRVRFTDECKEYWWFGPHTENKEGVVSLDRGADYDFDDGRFEVRTSDSFGIVGLKHIEPLPVAAETQPAALQIEAGKSYRTRDGRKVGPMERDDWGDGQPWTCGERWYSDNGSWLGNGQEDKQDLIAEWVDEPAVSSDTVAVAATASNDNAAPAKFKVGDMVRIVRKTGASMPDIGTEGEITGAGEGYLVETEKGAYGYDDVDLEPVTHGGLTVTIALDADAFHEELDEIIAKLKKIRKLQRQTGLAA